MSRIVDVLDALVAAVAGINGTGSYTNDLSATGAVFVASGFPQGAPDKCVWIFPGGIDTEVAGLGVANITQWKRTMTFGVNGFIPGTADTPYARYVAAASLYDDIWTALMSNRQLGGSVIDTTISDVLALDGSDAGFPGVGVCSMTVTVFWRGTLGAP